MTVTRDKMGNIVYDFQLDGKRYRFTDDDERIDKCNKVCGAVLDNGTPISLYHNPETGNNYYTVEDEEDEAE